MHRTKAIRRGKTSSHGLGLWWTFAAALIVAGAFIVAIAGNSRSVRLHYLAWHVDVSLIVVILTTGLLAVLLDEAGGLIWRRRRRARLGRRAELGELRARHRELEEPPVVAERLSPPDEVSALSAQSGGPDI